MFLVTLMTCHLDKRDKQLTMDQLVRLSSRSSHLGTIAWSTTFLVTFTLERDRAFSKYTLKHSFNTDIHTSSGNGSSSSKHSPMTTSTTSNSPKHVFPQQLSTDDWGKSLVATGHYHVDATTSGRIVLLSFSLSLTTVLAIITIQLCE